MIFTEYREEYHISDMPPRLTFFFWTRDSESWTQVIVFVRQALYRLSFLSSPHLVLIWGKQSLYMVQSMLEVKDTSIAMWKNHKKIRGTALRRWWCFSEQVGSGRRPVSKGEKGTRRLKKVCPELESGSSSGFLCCEESESFQEFASLLDEESKKEVSTGKAERRHRGKDQTPQDCLNPGPPSTFQDGFHVNSPCGKAGSTGFYTWNWRHFFFLLIWIICSFKTSGFCKLPNL